MYPLIYFQKIAQLNNMTLAAKELHVSQPTLSRALKNFEKEIGVELFTRKGRNLELNEKGQFLLEIVNRSLGDLQKGITTLREREGLIQPTIRLTATFPHTTLILLRDYLRENPKVNMYQIQADSFQMKKLIEGNEVDFALSSYPIESPLIHWHHLVDDEIFLTVSLDHPLSQHETIELTELSQYPFIGLPKGYGFRDITDQLCYDRGFQVTHRIELEESHSILQLVAENMGVSFTPGLSMLIDHPRIHFVKINDESFCRPIGLSYKKGSMMSDQAKDFLAHIMQFFSKYSSKLAQARGEG